MLLRPPLALLAAAMVAVSFAAAPKSVVQEHHTYDLLDVRWDLSFDFGGRSISGSVVNRITTLSKSAELYFDCGDLKIDSVAVDGKPATARKEGWALVITPAAPLPAGTTVDVSLKYHGAPKAGVYFVPAKDAYPATTDLIYSQGEMEDNRNWLPTYDHPDDKATSEGTIHVPAGWSALSNGTLIEKKKEPKGTAWHWKMTQPHATYLISLVAGQYTEVPDGKFKDAPVSIWAPKGLESWGKAAFGGTDKIIAFYSKLTGVDYPWPKYSQSAVPDFMFGGMENVTCTTQTIGAIFPPELKGHLDSTGLVAHELAHQWTGDLITTPTWNHIWVNEGWASFLPNFYTRETLGKDAYDLGRLGAFQGGLGGHHGNPNRPEVWDGWKEPFDMFDGFAYPGGASRMYMLLHLLGEDTFWKATKDYLTEYGFKNVTTEQLISAYEKSSGKDLDAFRKQWFYTSGVPEVKVTRKADGSYRIDGTKGYVFDLEVAWLNSGKLGPIRKLTVPAEGVVVPAEAGLLVPDPDVWLMADVNYSGVTPDEITKMILGSPSAAQRSRLWALNSGSLSNSQRLQIAKAEKVPDLLLQMVGSLNDTDYLLELTKSPNKQLVSNAIDRLGLLPRNEQVLSRLRVLLKTADELNRATALESLVKLTGDSALVEQAWQTSGFREQFRAFALEYWARNNPDRARKEALAAIDLGMTQPVRSKAVEVLGRLKDAPGEHKVYEHLTAILASGLVNPVRGAMSALGNYGDKAAIPLIAPFKDHPLIFMRWAATDAVAKLERIP